MAEEIKIPKQRPERVKKILSEADEAAAAMDADQEKLKKKHKEKAHKRAVLKAKGQGKPIPKPPVEKKKRPKRYVGGQVKGKGSRLCVYMDAALHQRLVDACEPRHIYVSGAIQAAVKLWLKLPKEEAKASALACQKRLRIA